MTGSAVDDLQAAEDHIGTLYDELRRLARLVPVRDPGRFCRCDIDIYDESDGPDVCRDEDCGCQCGQHRDEGDPEPEPWPVVDPASTLVMRLGDGPDWMCVLDQLVNGQYTVRLLFADETTQFADLLGYGRDEADGFETLEVVYTGDDDLGADPEEGNPVMPGVIGYHSTFVRIDALAGIEVF